MKIDWSGRSHNFTNEDINYLLKVIKFADPLTQGVHLKKFESDFSKYIKNKNILAVSSAAAALEMIASILNLKKGDEVIVPSHTYCADLDIILSESNVESKFFFRRNNFYVLC